jgi:hypothetical protein
MIAANHLSKESAIPVMTYGRSVKPLPRKDQPVHAPVLKKNNRIIACREKLNT